MATSTGSGREAGIAREKQDMKIEEPENTPKSPVGTRLNEWQRPITEYGTNDPLWEKNLKSNPNVGDIDFGRKQWARARDAVNRVMEELLKALRKHAEKYEGLKIDSYIRQGSSRDGLKVLTPDEFDTVFEFHIEGLQWDEVSLRRNGQKVPGFCYIGVKHTMEVLKKRYPRLCSENAFKSIDDHTLGLSSKYLHQVLFKSLVDKSCHNIQETFKTEAKEKKETLKFVITSRMNPPSINIDIQLNDEAAEQFMVAGLIRNKTEEVKHINMDIVPALRLRFDNETMLQGQTLQCPIHAVCKWAESENANAFSFANSDMIWHINTAGYERHTLDIARKDQKQQYILTALRIMKAVLVNLKKMPGPPPQITTVLKSYHLKQIAFYMILYLCHLYPKIRIDGVQKALMYFLALLKATLEKKHLPHFFYSNSKIQQMFPKYPAFPGLRFDLLRNKKPESLLQAKLNLENLVGPLLGLTTANAEAEFNTVISNYSREISVGEFF